MPIVDAVLILCDEEGCEVRAVAGKVTRDVGGMTQIKIVALDDTWQTDVHAISGGVQVKCPEHAEKKKGELSVIVEP